MEASPEEIPRRLDDWVGDKHLEKKPKVMTIHLYCIHAILLYLHTYKRREKKNLFMKTYALLIHDSVVLAFVLLHGNVCYVLS